MNVHRSIALFLLLSLCVTSVALPNVQPARAIQLAALPVVDDFEAPLVTNGMAGTIPIGFLQRAIGFTKA